MALFVAGAIGNFKGIHKAGEKGCSQVKHKYALDIGKYCEIFTSQDVRVSEGIDHLRWLKRSLNEEESTLRYEASKGQHYEEDKEDKDNACHKYVHPRISTPSYQHSSGKQKSPNRYPIRQRLPTIVQRTLVSESL